MNQIFHPSMNTIARVSIIGGGLLVAVLAAGWYFFVRSPFMTDVGLAAEQPIPFSHLHHVSEVGLECRYCHTSVEDAAFAVGNDPHDRFVVAGPARLLGGKGTCQDRHRFECSV